MNMNFSNIWNKIKSFKFGYDAASPDKFARKTRLVNLNSEDEVLNGQKRKNLVSNVREGSRNFTSVGWAVRRHLDYVAGYELQFRTKNKELNKQLEKLFKKYSDPSMCDTSGRFTLSEIIRYIESQSIIDGDCLLIIRNDGSTQIVSGTNIMNPPSNPSANDSIIGNISTSSTSKWVHGVLVDKSLRHLKYSIRTQLSENKAEYRIVDAKNAILFGFMGTYNQVRGISPISAALNQFADIYEAKNYALAKAKVSQLFALAMYRTGPTEVEEDQDIADYSSQLESFGKGPVYLNLDPGDRAEMLESRTPSSEFSAFMTSVLQEALKCLDIPFSFYDESYSTYSGSRQALLQYRMNIKARRKCLFSRLDKLIQILVQRWYIDDLISLPSDVNVEDIEWTWVPTTFGWVNPLQEVQADSLAVKNRLASRTERMAQRGEDFESTIDRIAEEEEYMRFKNVEFEQVEVLPIESQNNSEEEK